MAEKSRNVISVLFNPEHALCSSIAALLEYYRIVGATDEERRVLAAAGLSTRDQ